MTRLCITILGMGIRKENKRACGIFSDDPDYSHLISFITKRKALFLSEFFVGNILTGCLVCIFVSYPW